MSAAYIRGRNRYLRLQPSAAESEPSTEMRKLHTLGWNDARRQARSEIVQLQFALDSDERRNENVPVPLEVDL